jgi:SecD/SecF fusion protein
MLIRELVPGEKEVLVVVDRDERLRVEGSHLSSVVASYDQTMRPCVNFRMNSQGSKLFGLLTRRNLPDKEAGSYAHLGIVMDEALLSAPRIQSTITSQGEISGNFTQEEVDELTRVLKAGRLPAVLNKDPISDYNISSLLGRDTIQKGKVAILISIVGVLAFMLIYYRFAGMVACLAVAANLVLIYALMIVIKAAFTLPGLAGLVLTVGMSVDANVLIFERIREELRRGTTLRMAIRNGFDRATTTIVDANITTLITALVLYGIGTDQIRGFAITLILGILMSMFTAIFCSRAIFEIAERRGWIKQLSMMQLISETNINFIGFRKVAAALSLILILIGFGAVAARGKKIFDIDFNGGTSVQAVLREPMPIEDVRAKLVDVAEDVSITEVTLPIWPANTVYKIDTSIESEDELQAKLKEAFINDLGESGLKTHSMEWEFVDSAKTAANPFKTRTPITQVADDLQPIDADVSTAGERAAFVGRRGILLAQADPVDTNPVDLATEGVLDTLDTSTAEDDASDTTTTDAAATDTEADASDTAATEATDNAPQSGETADATSDDSPDESVKSVYRTTAKLTFDEEIDANSLRRVISQTAEKANIEAPFVELSNPSWDGRSGQGFDVWQVRFSTDTDGTSQLLDNLQAELSGTPAWLSSSKIGSAVAGKMKTKAVAAILVSLLGIVAYIWIRFQRVGFGLAAVLALVHDVAITLGAIAVSFWLAKSFGFLMIEEFKISLAIVAAFLTIVGYSLNDTIVVFDRIREVRGKSPQLREEMVNTSINQTLGRTVLTSTTTLIVVLILYTMGGQGIHGFAFALLIGVLVGTYSSMFVASPALLWMTQTASDQGGGGKKKEPVIASTSN